MIVVLDSNIWLSELGLRSNAGAAVCFYLNHHDATLAIPEIVRLEVEQNMRQRLTKHVQEVETNYNQLLTAFGKLKEIVLPTEAEIETKSREIFTSLDVKMLDVPFELESARSSFLKTIRKEAPSDRSQQFKDGVLWSDCLGLLADDSVILVTADKAFYQDRNYKYGLATSLRDEASELAHEIRILSSIHDLLDDIKAAFALDEAELLEAYLGADGESLHGIVERNGFELGTSPDVTYSLFATEDPKTLFLKFRIDWDCVDIQDKGRTEGAVHVEGDGSFDLSDETFRDLRNFGEHLRFKEADGSEAEQRNVVLHTGGITLGHRVVSRQVRYRLPDGHDD